MNLSNLSLVQFQEIGQGIDEIVQEKLGVGKHTVTVGECSITIGTVIDMFVRANVFERQVVLDPWGVSNWAGLMFSKDDIAKKVELLMAGACNIKHKGSPLVRPATYEDVDVNAGSLTARDDRRRLLAKKQTYWMLTPAGTALFNEALASVSAPSLRVANPGHAHLTAVAA